MRVALTSSDTAFADPLLATLEEAGRSVLRFDTPQLLAQALGHEHFDLLLVDGAGFGQRLPHSLRRLAGRRGFDAPLILANCPDSETLLADGFALGADDFIRRGAGPREVLARIDAVLRRRNPALSRQTARLHFRPYSFDLAARVACLHGKAAPLTDKEFDLAVFLFRNVGRLITRNRLLESVWRGHGAMLTRTVDTHISRLRKRLALDNSNGYRLVSAYGAGYRLERTRDDWVSPLRTVAYGVPPTPHSAPQPDEHPG